MDENTDTIEDVFLENIQTNHQVSQDLQDFMEILNTEKETEEQEKKEQQKIDQAVLKEQKELTEFYKSTLSATSETNSDLLLELQTLNENFLLEQEKQNALHAESTITIVLAIVIALSLQSFFSQITKW